MPASALAYHDPLEQLNRPVPLHDKVRAIHRVIQERLDSIDRIAAAVYDPKSDLLKTFVASAADDDLPLRHYQGHLSESPSLCEILRSGSPRVIDDLTAMQVVVTSDEGCLVVHLHACPGTPAFSAADRLQILAPALALGSIIV